MRKHRIYKFLLLTIIGFASLLIIDFLYTNTLNVEHYQNKYAPNANIGDNPHPGYIIKTEGCSIPDLRQKNRKIRRYFFNAKPIVCTRGLQPLFESNLTSIYLQEDVLPSYNTTLGNLKCCFQYFKEVDCTYFEESFNIDESKDFVKLICKNKENSSGVVYEDYFPIISNKFTETKEVIQDNELNILIFGFDAVSRINLHRQMPRTVKYLKKLDAVEMFGYNKIGDNTFPNLVTLFTGHNPEELKRLCWFNNDDVFDNCEFIWDRLKARGYVTAFGEDAANIGTFNYLRGGFKKQPTDYYYNYFNIEAADAIGNFQLGAISHCIGSRQTHRVTFNYGLNYTLKMFENQKKFFGFFWTSLTHDYLNMAQLGDVDFENILIDLQNSGVLNNTALIFMSDHGMRFGNFRYTYQGALEDRLPYMFFILPEWFKEKHSEGYNNLKTNTKRLITLFDLYETILELSNLENLTVYQAKNKERGISLFRPISEKRTCDEAGIDPHWCTCKERRQVDIKDPQILEVVQFALHNYINKLLTDYEDCYTLGLDYIIDATIFDNDSQKTVKNYDDYSVTFKAKPGGGIFEATIRKSVDGLEVMGSVSRLNLYGDQSKCVDNALAKLFCYCK